MGAIIVFILIFVITGLFTIKVHNYLISLRHRSEDAWSGVEAQLKRRYEVIPNIVAAMEEHAKYDRPVLHSAIEAVSLAKGSYNIREKIGAESFLSTSLESLFAVAQKYPQLKANENFRGLQITLSQIESAIQSARRIYNDTVQDYNSRLEAFPNNIIAKFFNLKNKKPF